MNQIYTNYRQWNKKETSEKTFLVLYFIYVFHIHPYQDLKAFYRCEKLPERDQ